MRVSAFICCARTRIQRRFSDVQNHVKKRQDYIMHYCTKNVILTFNIFQISDIFNNIVL